MSESIGSKLDSVTSVYSSIEKCRPRHQRTQARCRWSSLISRVGLSHTFLHTLSPQTLSPHNLGIPPVQVLPHWSMRLRPTSGSRCWRSPYPRRAPLTRVTCMSPRLFSSLTRRVKLKLSSRPRWHMPARVRGAASGSHLALPEITNTSVRSKVSFWRWSVP